MWTFLKDNWPSLLLAATFVVALLGYLNSRKGVGLQKRSVRLSEKDRQKANLTATITKETSNDPLTGGHRTTRFLEVQNNGPSGARDVQVFIDGTPISEHKHITTYRPSIPALGAGSSARFLVFFPLGIAPPADVRIEWSDDSGEAQVYESSFGTDLWIG